MGNRISVAAGTRFSLFSLTVMAMAIAAGVYGQEVTGQRDNTRPETADMYITPSFINSFSVIRGNAQNEISWGARSEQDTRRYIIEYSLNGIDYQSAGEQVAGKSTYSLLHHLADNRPLLYRARTELKNGKIFYSAPVFVPGIGVSPVTIYPTAITGNTINAIAQWPVERIIITSANGTQVLAKEVNGQRDYMAIVVPSPAKGMYFMTFIGSGWRATEKFVVP